MALGVTEVGFPVDAWNRGAAYSTYWLDLGLRWRVVSASVAGTSHSAAGAPCQDSCIAWQEEFSTPGKPVLFMFAADGAGSAAKGKEGADLAIQAAAQFAHSLASNIEFPLNDEIATQCVIAVRDRIYLDAEETGSTARDYACTFLGVISTAWATLLMQIGDGGIAVLHEQILSVPIPPMLGEYANMTHFITDENALDMLASKTLHGPVAQVAVFTDGLQRLAMNMRDLSAHEPFFAPFFSTLQESSEDQREQLEYSLVNFLNGAAVNERTDDDKTLAMAVLAP